MELLDLFTENGAKWDAYKKWPMLFGVGGPDDTGVFEENYDANHHIGLCHRRLSIIDLSSNGHQPMMDKEQRIVVVVFNGEIYNFRAIRKELQNKGCSFISDSDTEVLIHAYKVWGIDFVHKLNGMFSIALL
ncbi:MAG: hypothetical protein H6925_01565 [Holosporaceae bacterium]|nr:MAG: hypothetical protein H6925_01565 [Holosporaceae bacterium]